MEINDLFNFFLKGYPGEKGAQGEVGLTVSSLITYLCTLLKHFQSAPLAKS